MAKIKTKKAKLIKCKVTTSQEEKPGVGYWQELVGEFELPERFLKLLLDNTFKKHLQLNYQFKKKGPNYFFELTKNQHNRKIEILVLEIVNLFRYWNITHEQASKITEVKNKIQEISKLVKEFDELNPSPPNGYQ